MARGGGKVASLHAPSPTVRRASRSEAAAIAALVNRAYEVERSFKVGDRTTVEEIERLAEDGAFLVLDGAQGGLAAAVHVRAEGGRASFGMLSVDPDLQRAGIGRRLVAIAESYCQAQGCHLMEIAVVNLREDLPPFYRRLGYEVSGTAPFPAPGELTRPAHFILMAKPLSLAPMEAGPDD
jgi:GNAT superfamily N-acetyltransferase